MNLRPFKAAMIAAASIAATPAVQGQPATAKQQPLEHFAELPFMSAPQLSPDGTRVAAKLSVDGQQVLAVLNLFDKAAKPALIRVGKGDLKSWHWVNDQWLVARIRGTATVNGRAYSIGRIAGVSADGATVKPIAFDQAGQWGDDIIWIADDGTPRLLLSLQTSIYKKEDGFWPEVMEVDISTGRTRTRLSGRTGVRQWHADSAGIVRMGIGYNDSTRTSRLLYRAAEDKPFRTVDRADKRQNEMLTIPALFLAEPGKAVTLTKEDGYDVLRALDLSTLEPGEKIFSVPGHDVGDIIANRTGDQLVGASYTDTRQRIHWFNPDLARVQADIDKAIGPERSATVVSLSRDQQKMLVHVGGPDQPGAYYYYNVRGSVMQHITYLSSKLTGRYAPVRTIRYQARDGLEIAAVLTTPKGREAKALPLIVMPHGGPDSRDQEMWDWQAQFLADRGYAVIQPNYRGSTGYGDAFRDKAKNEWGLKMQDDLNDAITHLAKQGIADPGRVCMVGGSYGGYAAIRAAQRDGGLYRCAVSFGGVSDLEHIVRENVSLLNRRTLTDYWIEKAPDLAIVSPINFPAEFSTPLLLIHGKKDLRVPIWQSQNLAR